MKLMKGNLEVVEHPPPVRFKLFPLPPATKVSSDNTHRCVIVDSALVQICVKHGENFWMAVARVNQGGELINSVLTLGAHVA